VSTKVVQSLPDRLRQGQERNLAASTEPRDELTLVSTSGGGAGGADAEVVRTRGMFSSSGGGGRASSTLAGLVPDGVATVTVEYPRAASRGPDFKPVLYPSRFRRTVTVRDNVVSLRVPRPAPDAVRVRMIWRDARGRVIRVVPSGP